MDLGLKIRAHLSLVLAATQVAGCAGLGYYAHLANGQMDLLARRERIDWIVEDSRRDADLRRRLALVLDARHFAIETLRLPDNGSYTLYADIGRPYVVWNVFATPEFSLQAIESCFPLAGCLAYRGYYDKAKAQQQADLLRQKGYDVDVGGVPAYSTLGWFDDPVLSTMLRWSDANLVGTVFHELGHQRVFVKGDTTFNESYARFVEQQGLREFFAAGRIAAVGSETEREREGQFVALVIATRRKLDEIYSLPLSPEAMREQKALAFTQLRRDYEALRDGRWNGDRDYDGWFARDLNNATLLPVGLYDEWVPAFSALFAQSGRDWTRFHSACAELGRLDTVLRKQRLAELQASAAAPPPAASP
ncbi:MAG: aminopeptidase [Panacagrimonas sp.]|nr:aminopeptidase [Panacagrimonas sp.]MCC2656605.1 aminopeptidase [Panacagrimonas sp.]